MSPPRSFAKESTPKIHYLAAVAFTLIAAIFSSGFHHYDEHYHVLEFLAYKAGKTTASELPWEFGAQIRSWLLPAFLYPFSRTFSDPLITATIFRLLGAILNLVTLLVLIRRWARENRWATLLLCYLWFFPYIHVRTSIENWSGALFFLGLALPGTAQIATGLLWGLAFQMRLQIAPMILGALVWGIFFDRRLRFLPHLTLGVAVSLLMGLTVDYWGYGQWTLPWWNYLMDQWTHNRASNWGTAPFWYFITEGLIKGGPPLSLILVGSTLLSWWYFPKHLLTWVTLPFVLIHSLEPHKELRFLFPMLYATAFQVALIADRYPWLTKKNVMRPLAAINFILLACVIFRPAESRARLYAFLQKYYSNQTIYYVEDDPYVLFKMPLNFYRPTGLATKQVPPIPDQNKFVLVSSRFRIPDESNCSRVWGLLPLWLEKFNFNHWIERTKVWTVYECNY